MSEELQNKVLFQQVVALVKNAQQQVIRTINSTMVYTYFEIGRMIVEKEQNGKERAAYGKQVLKELSKELTKEFGRGFSLDNLQNMRKLYFFYSNYETVSSISKVENQKSETVSRKFEIQKTQTSSMEIENSKMNTLFSFFKLNLQINTN